MKKNNTKKTIQAAQKSIAYQMKAIERVLLKKINNIR